MTAKTIEHPVAPASLEAARRELSELESELRMLEQARHERQEELNAARRERANTAAMTRIGAELATLERIIVDQ
nr:hypothetical protein [Gemmatimonadaceae bacterium]